MGRARWLAGLVILAAPFASLLMLGLAMVPLSRPPDSEPWEIVAVIAAIVLPLWIGLRAMKVLEGKMRAAALWAVTASAISLAMFLGDLLRRF